MPPQRGPPLHSKQWKDASSLLDLQGTRKCSVSRLRFITSRKGGQLKLLAVLPFAPLLRFADRRKATSFRTKERESGYPTTLLSLLRFTVGALFYKAPTVKRRSDSFASYGGHQAFFPFRVTLRFEGTTFLLKGERKSPPFGKRFASKGSVRVFAQRPPTGEGPSRR